MPRVLGLLPAPVDVGRNVEIRLPLAALEFESPSAAIIATPVPRFSRATILFVFLLVVALVAAAAVIRIDRIVSARGKLVADAPNIVMQAFDQTIIQSIEVKKGDIVRKGQVLARLNPTFAGADHTSIKDQVDLLGARVERLLAAAAGRAYLPDSANAHAALQATISGQQTAEYEASLQNYDKQIDQLRTQIAGDKAQADYFGERLAVATDVEEMRKKLQQMQTGSLLYTLQATDIRLTMAASRSRSESDAAQGDRRLAALEAERMTFIEQWNGRRSQELAETQGKLTLALQELAKAELHNALVVLTAPRDSVVLSVGKISVGSVVSSAEPLLQLVPIDTPLSVEADISGMESGHVTPGDEVTIKFDTLPFLQYGSARGLVVAISPDSFSPETSEGDGGSTMPSRPNTLYYRADISLDTLMMHDTPAGFRPMPGMPITADVKVGTRSVLSYFVDKILPRCLWELARTMSMAALHLMTTPLDRIAARFPKHARARAERLSEVAPERALALFSAAAEAGDTEAAFLVGERYLEGKGTVAHTIEAARWFHRAATKGHVRAQCRLAKLYLLGLPQAALETKATLFDRDDVGYADHRAALAWARPAAEAGASDAQAMMGFILTSGPDDLRNTDDAFLWYEKSAAQHNPQGRLGYIIALMLRADTDQKKTAAFFELASVAAIGIPTAHYLLGMSFERGIGTSTDDTRARRHYEIAAETGLHSAQARFGLMLLEGRGGRTDALIGESWLRRAAYGGDAEAAALLGDIYARGGTVPPNYEEAASWFRRAAELGHSTAAHALGMLHLTGAGVIQDADEAAVWFKRAAEAGDCRAQADLAELLQSGSGATLFLEPPPVHEWFERAAEEGDLVGAFNYAVCLAEGVGMPRDDERAAFWLKRAAEGVVSAQYWYGRMLAEGRGVEQDDEEAVAWFTRAAEAGLADAQVALAEMTLDGRGVPRDHVAAESWFLRALPEGHVGAMFGLGELHSGGHDTEADYEVAAHWFAQAAACGHPIACLMLARYAVLGLGAPRDFAAGRKWYEAAVSFGVPGAADELATLNETSPALPDAAAFDVEFRDLLCEPTADPHSAARGYLE